MIGHQEALIYTMVMVSASDGEMTDAELNTIGDIIKHLPIFQGYNLATLGKTAEACAELLADPAGLDTAGDLKLRLPIVEAVRDVFQDLYDKGLTRHDHSAFLLHLEELNSPIS